LCGKIDTVRQAYDAQAPEFELARELIAARTQADLTQGEVAARMGTTQSVVARIESGRGHLCEQSNGLPVRWVRVLWCTWSL
jgi:transcriptional regulator with XRE-family HTH domain